MDCLIGLSAQDLPSCSAVWNGSLLDATTGEGVIDFKLIGPRNSIDIEVTRQAHAWATCDYRLPNVGINDRKASTCFRSGLKQVARVTKA